MLRTIVFSEFCFLLSLMLPLEILLLLLLSINYNVLCFTVYHLSVSKNKKMHGMRHILGKGLRNEIFSPGKWTKAV